MAEKKIKNKKSELLRELIGMYQPQSVGDITDMLKDLFADTMEDMLQAELGTARTMYGQFRGCKLYCVNARNMVK